MEFYKIQGKNQLSGEIAVSGAKNFALKCFGAAILMDKPLNIARLPEIADVHRMMEIMSAIGVGVKHDEHNNTVQVDGSSVKSGDLRETSVGKIRASVLLIGPLLHRLGEVFVQHPGGCVLGKRPIDLFLDGFTKMGAEVEEKSDCFVLRTKRLKGATIVFPIISVTATEALMTTATIAEGTTVLKNAAQEPEVVALAEMLNRCGAKISGAGTSTIIIEGVEKLSGTEVECIADRLETATFAIMAAATRSEITITNCVVEHVEALLAIFDRMGVPYSRTENTLTIHKYDHVLKAVDIRTHEYPGVVTDYQAPLTVLLTQAEGLSMVHETVFEGRLFYTDLLNRMGAKIIMCDPHRVIVQGPAPLKAKMLESPDIRAGIAMVIAGLIAEGETTIHNIYQIERGYERLEERLQKLGAKIERIKA